MYYVVELISPIQFSATFRKLHPLCATIRLERWVFTNKRAAKLKYREACRDNCRRGKYHEYGIRHGEPIMRVHKHNKYTSEIVVTLQRLPYTPKKLHEVKICEGYTR